MIRLVTYFLYFLSVVASLQLQRVQMSTGQRGHQPLSQPAVCDNSSPAVTRLCRWKLKTRLFGQRLASSGAAVASVTVAARLQ